MAGDAAAAVGTQVIVTVPAGTDLAVRSKTAERLRMVRDELVAWFKKLAYRIGEPHHGDIVMLYYPIDPNKSFVKRVVAEEGDTVRIVDGNVFVNETPMKDDLCPRTTARTTTGVRR